MIHDTYFYLLENPAMRQLGLAGSRIEYHTPSFDMDVYQRGTGRSFAAWEDAYEDWQMRGRQAGAEWSPGKDTLLKIILKTKDEFELIDAWIAHHAAIVGYENLIILDCGSTDPRYIKKLQEYSAKILIFQYRRYYDHIHATRSNAAFFNLVAANCRYVTILDSDEFLFAKKGASLSRRHVKHILREQGRAVFWGSWLNSVDPVPLREGVIDLSMEIKIQLTEPAMAEGSFSGKTLARTDILMDMGHLGHNLHEPDAVRFGAAESFGSLFVLHIKNLGAEVNRSRILKHLFAKKAIMSDDVVRIRETIAALIASPDTKPDVLGYAKKYVQTQGEETPQHGRPCSIRISNGDIIDASAGLIDFISNFDYAALFEKRIKELRIEHKP